MINAQSPNLRRLGIAALLLAIATGPIALVRQCTSSPHAVIDHGQEEPELEVRGLLGPTVGGGFVPPTKLGGGTGDITAVTAGNGLTGGATSGAATIDVAVGTGLSVGADIVNLNLAGASCGAGEFVSAISATGTGTCTAEPGDVAAVTAGAGLTGGGTSGSLTIDVAVGSGLQAAADAVNLNLAGASCGAGQSVTAISSIGTGTCSIPIANDYAGTHIEWVEEYMLKSAISSGAPFGIFSGVPVGSGAAVNDGTGTATTRPGIAVFTTGTTATGSASLQTNLAAIDFGSGSWVWQETLGMSTLSTAGDEYAVLVGFSDSTTINVTDGCYLLYDRGNVATGGPNTGNADKWSCWCASNATRTKYLMDGTTVSDESFTTVDSPVAAYTAPSTNIYTVEVRMAGTTRSEFFVNGSKRCNISTNLPSGSTRMTGIVHGIFKSAGTNARTMAVDRHRAAVDLNSARSP